VAPSRSPANHTHAVQFYGSESTLYSTAATFLSEGLILGQPALILATPEHRDGIVEQLYERLVDCECAVRDGDLVLLDAQATLDLFMVDDRPSVDLFHENVGRIVGQVLNGRKRTVLRAYGEMVDLLWRQGRTEAAIELEVLWNKLALSFDFALLCGYAMGSFYKQVDQLESIRILHSHVINGPGKVIDFPARARAIT
jgi:MEDS: MEthanogen/methylotroph, DcmR Sensory domain